MTPSGGDQARAEALRRDRLLKAPGDLLVAAMLRRPGALEAALRGET